MSTEIKPGQVWAWNDPAGWSGPELTIVPVPEEPRPDNRPAYVYEEDEERTVWRITDDMLRRVAHLVKDVENAPAPLDPKSVHVGDTVTVRFKETGDEIVTKAYQPDDVTKPGEWVYLLGWPLHRPDGTFGLAFSYFEILAIEPAPVPEPEWEPGTSGTATVDGYVTRVMRTDGIGGADAFWVTPEIINGTRAHQASSVTDFVPDETRPLPTREQVAETIMTTDKTTGNYGLYPDVATKAADAVLALLRGESR